MLTYIRSCFPLPSDASGACRLIISHILQLSLKSMLCDVLFVFFFLSLGAVAPLASLASVSAFAFSKSLSSSLSSIYSSAAETMAYRDTSSFR